MSFYLEEEVPVSFDFDYRSVAREVVEECLSCEHFPYEAQVTLTLTDDEGIAEYNRRFRKIDRATDVLSFPLLSYESAGDFAFLKEERETDFDPDTGEAMLGDIILNVARVPIQAQSYGHSELREFAFLITHSMLHLFGYDHMNEEDAALMQEHQRVILTARNILR